MATKSHSNNPNISKNIHSLLLHANLVMAMALPMLIFYALGTLAPSIRHSLDINLAWIGYLPFSCFSLAAILSIWSGLYVNRFGVLHSQLVLFGSVTIAFTLLATVNNAFFLFIAVAFCSIAQSLSNPVTNLIIQNRVPKKQRTIAIGLKQSGVQIAALFSGLVMPYIALTFHWRVAAALISPVALTFMALSLILTPDKRIKTVTKAFPMKPQWPNHPLMLLMVTQFCIGLTLSAVVTFLPSYATELGLSIRSAGWLIAVFGLMGIISRLLFPFISIYFSSASTLIITLTLISALGILLLSQASSSNHTLIWLGTVCIGLSATASIAIAMSMLITDSNFGPLSTSSSLVSAAFFAGLALGSPLFSYLLQLKLDFSTSWLVLLIELFVTIAITLILKRVQQPPIKT